MNPNNYEALLMELSSFNNYSDFRERIETIDFNLLNEEQTKTLMEFYETIKKNNDTDTEVRKESMKKIMNM